MLIEIDGQAVWYEETGDGPAVLLLHAGGADHRMWGGDFDRPGAGHPPIPLALSGAGGSPYPEKPWSPDQLMAGVLDLIGVQHAAVVGVSLGAGVAIDFAIARPERTWALVVVAGGPRGITDVQPDPRAFEVYEA